MRTKYRSIGAMVLVATTMILAACIPPPEGPPPPQLTLPANIEVIATSGDGAIVSFVATGTFEGQPVPVVCDPPSGSLFPIGMTTVRCTATNEAGTTRSGTFTVSVLAPGTTTTTTAPTTPTTTTTTTTTSTTTTQPGPTTTLAPGSGPPAIAAGGSHTCAVRANGTLACWGYNLQGQVGDGSLDFTIRAPRTVSGLANVADVDAGFRHTCALRNDGQVFCWGSNPYGQLGNGGNLNQRTPSPVTNMANAKAIATGESHSCAVRTDGTVACWGDGFSGQLGGSQADSLVPRTVPGVNNVVSITAGAAHTCALRADRSAVCWGGNNNGQLGNGQTTTSLLPVTVQLSNISELSATSATTCATSNGTAYCWGNNAYGQLGGGTLENSVSTPLPVPNMTAAGIDVGEEHACARLATDGVRCFGRNHQGQLGNNTTADSLIRSTSDGSPIGYRTPVDIAGLSGVATVAAGGEHSCARRTNGTVACWGANADGQLGINSTAPRTLVPAEVTGL